MGKNQAYKAMQRARVGSASGGPDEIEDGMTDGSFHSPEWHAARLASLNTSHTITWEEFKKKQKEDELKIGEVEADKDRMMREYRAQLDAERASKLSLGRNHSSGKSHNKKEKKDRDKDTKKRSSGKRKHRRRSYDSSSYSSSSESSSSEDEQELRRSRSKSSRSKKSSESSSSDDERDSKRSRSKSRSKKSKKDKRHRSRTKHSNSDGKSDGPLPLSRFFGAVKS